LIAYEVLLGQIVHKATNSHSWPGLLAGFSMAAHRFRPVSVPQEPLRSGGIVGHFDQQPARSSNSFSGADTGLHPIEFDDLNASGSANGLNGFAIGLDPVIDRHMTVVQESTNGAKTQAFKVKLERLPLNCWMDAPATDRMSITTRLTVVTLPAFRHPIFGTAFLATFGASNHNY
jgi:hypothetical protein